MVLKGLVLLGVGVFGVGLLLGAFALSHFNKARRFGYLYNGLNFLGAGLLLIYSYFKRDEVFIILNLAWVLIALYFIAKKALHRISPTDALSDFDIEESRMGK